LIIIRAEPWALPFSGSSRHPLTSEHSSGEPSQRQGPSPNTSSAIKAAQFWNPSFKQWCKRKNIRPRFGAVGQHGSIALIERFIRSMKYEYLRHILVPMHITWMRQEVVCYIDWYNRHRPHQGLDGATPLEIYQNAAPANRRPRHEPRKHWPTDSGCAAPYAEPRPEQGKHLRDLSSHSPTSTSNCPSSSFAKWLESSVSYLLVKEQILPVRKSFAQTANS
jgi:hypothetical protein